MLLMQIRVLGSTLKMDVGTSLFKESSEEEMLLMQIRV